MSEIAKYQTPEERLAIKQQSAQNVANAKAKLSSILQTLKKPKFIAVFILLLTLGLVILGLSLIAQKPEEEPTVANIPKITPSAEPSVDTSLANIEKRVEIHNASLDNLINYSKKINYPIVDLDISFEK